MKRSTTLLVGAFAVTTLLGACGDDKKATDTPATTGQTSDYCQMVQDYKDEADKLDTVMSGTPDLAAVEHAFTTLQTMMHSLDDQAPESIAADVHVVTGSVDTMVTLLTKYEWDMVQAQASPEGTELSTYMRGEEYTTASDSLDAYALDTCDIAPSS